MWQCRQLTSRTGAEPQKLNYICVGSRWTERSKDLPMDLINGRSKTRTRISRFLFHWPSHKLAWGLVGCHTYSISCQISQNVVRTTHFWLPTHWACVHRCARAECPQILALPWLCYHLCSLGKATASQSFIFIIWKMGAKPPLSQGLCRIKWNIMKAACTTGCLRHMLSK